VRSAHDLAEGGLLVGLAEAALFGRHGVRCPALTGQVSAAALAFGESQGRVLVSAPPRRVPDVQKVMAAAGVPVHALGVVGGDELQVGPAVRVRLDRLREAWECAWDTP